jgi:hypothetical protein
MWPVWAARFGVRHISLALLLGLAAWAFWWSFGRIRNCELGIRNEEGKSGVAKDHSRHPLARLLPFALAGALLGLTAYTYQPARFVPLLFVGFALYLLLFHRRLTADSALWHNRRGWAVWGVTAAVVALPLIVVLTQVTPIETGERAFSIEPLTELLAGNPRPVLDNVVAVAGVFTVRGDPLKSYNLPDRPLFVPRLTGLFFYLGLALAVWRWRRPANAFVLLWLVAGLLPTVVTISAPNFNRMVAAQFPIFFLAALGATETIEWAAALGRPSPQPSATGRGGVVAAALVVVALGLTAAATARDLFRVWPEQFADAHPLNREIAAVADFLEHRADGRPVVISSRDIEDEDPYVVSVSLDRAIDRRWVDSSQALALPAGAAEAWLIVTADRWIDPLLADVVGLGAGETPPRPLGEGWGEGLPPRPVGEGWGEGLPPRPVGEGWREGLPPRPVGEGWGEGLPLLRATYSTTAIRTAGGLKPATTNPNRPKPVIDGAANPLQRVSLVSRGFQPAATQPVAAQPAPSSTDYANTFFSLHLLTAANWPTLPTPNITLPPESSYAPSFPVPFCACELGAAGEAAVWLTGVSVEWPSPNPSQGAGDGAPSPNPSQGAGDAAPSPNPSQGEGDGEVTLLTSWQTEGARFISLAMFVHLLDAAGNIVAQDDGLGYPPHTWQPGDRFLQLARLPLPPDLPPGDYTLQFGLYDRATGARWPVLNAGGQPAGDRLLLPLP